jgi:hypothetical protein
MRLQCVAIRLIRVKWHVTKIEQPTDGNNDDDEDEGLDWSNFQGTRLPIVHFAGTSKSLHASWDPNANSKIRGEYAVTWCEVKDERKLKLMRNEAPCGKLPKARSGGRHSPFSTARSDGGLKESKSVDCARREVCWEIGSTSMNRREIRMSMTSMLILGLLGIMMFTDLLDQQRSGKKVTSLRRRRMARDAIFDTRDELVYGGLYVTSQMAAVVSNNTRTTLDARAAYIICCHACACTASALLSTMHSCFFPLSCHL